MLSAGVKLVLAAFAKDLKPEVANKR